MEDAKKLGKKLTVNYAMIQSVYIMVYCSIFSFASVFLLSRGFTNSQVGLTLTLSSALALVFQPLVAAFADKTKKLALRSIVAIMMLGVTAFSLLLYFAPKMVLPTAILYILMVVLFSTQVSMVTTMSMEHINNGIPINFSLARGVGSLAFAILSFLLGYLVDDYGANVIMLINMGLGLIAVVLVLTFQKAKKTNSGNSGQEDGASGLIQFARQNKRFMAVVGSIALLFFSHVFINTFFIQIIKHVGGNNSDMGNATALAGLLELPAMALFPVIYKKMRNAGTIIKISGLFFILKAVITLLAPNVFWIDVAQCVQFFAYAMLTPASVYYVNQAIGDADKNKGQACMGMTMGISGLVGNYLGGLMLDSSGGVPLMLTVGTVVSLVGLVMLVLIDRAKPSAVQE
jgi:MFS transporter, PPP family, 3-phenylpropionic acid transporter